MVARSSTTDPAPSAHKSIKFIHMRLKIMGKSRHWLAKRSGVCKSSLTRYWNGQVWPTTNQMEPMLEAVGGESVFQMKMGA